jgi:hypothetical protein
MNGMAFIDRHVSGTLSIRKPIPGTPISRLAFSETGLSKKSISIDPQAINIRLDLL